MKIKSFTKKDRLLSMFVATVMAFAAFGFVGTEKTSAAADFSFDIETGTITKYNGSETVVNIPEEIAGYTVEKIGSSCFEKTKVTEVVIPDTVTEIGNAAFQECEYLQKVYIPYSVESIGYWAFYKCSSLKQVVIPSSVTEFKTDSINTRTFAGCTSLVSVIFQANVKDIPSRFCEGCTSLEYFEFSDSVTSIGYSAFSGCKSLVSVEFPANIETIGEYAYEGCTGLKNIYIPDTVSEVKGGAFYGCTGLKTAILNNASFKQGTLYYRTFAGCTSLTDVKIMNGTQSLGNGKTSAYGGMFSDCYSLVNVEIPSSVETIADENFADCSDKLTIYCEDGSYAMKFALAQGINYSFDEAPYFDNTPEKPVLTKDIDVVVNNKYLYFDQAPILQNSRVLVPIRAIAEALGAEVTWDSATSTAIVELDGSTVKIQLGNNIMTKDGSEITLDVPANMISNRILVPVRAVSEAFGCSVEWDGDTRTVFIQPGNGEAVFVGESIEMKRIIILQQRDNDAFSEMKKGFIDYIRDAGFSDRECEIIEQNAYGDSTVLRTIISDFATQDIDLIVTISTPATLAAIEADLDIPIVYIAVSDPIGVGIIDDWNVITNNATGTSNPIPIEQIFKNAMILTPDVETYGFIYSPSQSNAVSTVISAKSYLDNLNIPYEEVAVFNLSEVETAIASLGTKCDAFFIPDDSVIQAAMPYITEYATDNKIPIYSSSTDMATLGALAAITISNTAIGEKSAEMALKILNGENIISVASAVVDATDITINISTAEKLGISIPTSIKANAILVED